MDPLSLLAIFAGIGTLAGLLVGSLRHRFYTLRRVQQLGKAQLNKGKPLGEIDPEQFLKDFEKREKDRWIDEFVYLCKKTGMEVPYEYTLSPVVDGSDIRSQQDTVVRFFRHVMALGYTGRVTSNPGEAVPYLLRHAKSPSPVYIGDGFTMEVLASQVTLSRNGRSFYLGTHEEARKFKQPALVVHETPDNLDIRLNGYYDGGDYILILPEGGTRRFYGSGAVTQAYKYMEERDRIDTSKLKKRVAKSLGLQREYALPITRPTGYVYSSIPVSRCSACGDFISDRNQHNCAYDLRRKW